MKICLIYNYAQHYRSNIFRLLDSELNCDFYFGNKMDDVKKMDYSLLQHFRGEVKNIQLFYHFYYQKDVFKLLKEPYTHYIILGDLFCISTWLILFFSRINGKKIYLWTHGWYGHETFLKKILKRIFFRMSKGVFLYGEYARNLMIKEGIDEHKLHVIYNSLDYDKQLLIRNTLSSSAIYQKHFRNKNLNLIFIGRLTKVKHLDMIIYSMAQLHKKGYDYNLTLIGDGDQCDNLKFLSKKENVNNIWFYGACYDEDVLAKLIYNSDLCISPGNVGLTAIHSMSYGTPVLTHDCFSKQMPEFESIQENVTGLFFEYGSINSLSTSIINWFKLDRNRDSIRYDCFKVIDEKYNPHKQLETIRKNIIK